MYKTLKLDNLCPQCFNETFINGRCTACGYYDAYVERHEQALPRYFVLNKRYVIGEILGAGGFGITYIAYDIEEYQKKAIKEYYPQASCMRNMKTMEVEPLSSKVYEYEKGLNDFHKEADVLYQMREIYGVVRVDDLFDCNGTSYMVMDFIEGVSLRTICKGMPGAADFETANSQFISMAYTLDEVHLHGMLHRDVSPDNMMVCADNSIKLLDFGAARHETSRANATLTIILKPGFAPLEQYSRNGVQGPWTDIYGLGASFYWYLSGRKIPDAPSRQSGAEVESLYKIRGDVPKEFSDIIDKAIALNYRERYQNISELLNDVNELTGQVAKSSTPIYEEKTVKKEKRRDRKRREKEEQILRQESASNNKYLSNNCFLKIISGPCNGYMYQLSKNIILTIGRKSEYCDVVINYESISRRHCTIQYNPSREKFIIVDYSSTGTFLNNGEKLIKEEPYYLNVGDRFYLSTRDFLFEIINLDI